MPPAKLDLRRIGPDELVAGQPLPGDLRNAEGHIILPAGQILQPAHLQNLEARVTAELYAGPDWDGNMGCTFDSPTAVVDQVLHRFGEQGPTANRRAQQRHPWSVLLTVVIEEAGDDRSIPREIQVTTVDISRRGFAFYYRQYISLDTRVRAQFDSLPNRPRVAGVVRNCRLTGGARHRIGVQFIQPKELKAADGRRKPA